MSLIKCAVLAAVSTLALPGIALAAPAVTLSPAVGPPTTRLTATGTGFGANAAVDVFFDAADLCLTFADGTGKATCNFKVPASAQPQQHWVSMMQRSDSTGAQKAFLVRTDWAQFHGRNGQHTGNNPFENTLNTGNVSSLDVLWSAPIGAFGATTSPVVSGGRVYVASLDKNLYAFDALAGTPVAGFPKSFATDLISTPAVAGGNIYVGTPNGDKKLFAFNAATGVPLAGYPLLLSNDLAAPLTAANGIIYAVDFNGLLQAINAKSGTELPNFPVALLAAVDSAPAVAAGRLYVGGLDDKVHAIDAVTGAALSGFTASTTSFLTSSAAVTNGVIYIGSDDGKLNAFDTSTGASITGFPITTGSVIQSAPGVAGGRVFFTSQDGIIHAHNALDGSLIWSRQLDPNPVSGPVIANSMVFVSGSNHVYALSIGGALLWSASVSVAANNNVVVANGIVYVSSLDGRLYAYSVNGLQPAARLPGGALGVKPALPALKPDYTLRPSSGVASSAPAEDE
jgi:outer membrane protein assembly factor BamB